MPTTYSTSADLLSRLLVMRGGRTLEEFSASFSVSPQFMSMVLAGRRSLGKQIVEKMGFRPVVMYERMGQTDQTDLTNAAGLTNSPVSHPQSQAESKGE